MDAIDRLLGNLDERIKQIVGVAMLGGYIKRDVELADATDVPIAHELGRPASVFLSPPRNPSSSGRIEEVRSDSFDLSKYTVIRATGYGATITVDVWMF